MKPINPLIGTITRGENLSSGDKCDILVEWVYNIAGVPFSVRGRVIEGGKLTRRKAVQMAKHGLEAITYGDPDYLHPIAHDGIPGRLRVLEPGQSIEVTGENVLSWRNAAERLKVSRGLIYTVNKTPKGICATRIN